MAYFVALFAPVLFSANLIANGDAVLQAAPTFFGRTPLIEPNLMLGYPLFADPNQAYWYPVLRLARLIPDGFNMYVLFPYVAIAFGTFGFARAFTGSFVGALVAAATVSLGGFMFGHSTHLMILHPSCWAPYVLWAIAVLRERSSRLVVAAGAVALALGLMAGTQQPLVYLVFAGLVFAIVFRPDGAARQRAYARDVVMMFALGVGFSAISLVPGYELVHQSTRAHQTIGELSYNAIGKLEFPIRVLFPYFLGDAASALYLQERAAIGAFMEDSNYAGILPLMLAIAALLDPVFKRRAFFWAGVAVWSAWMSLGRQFGAAWISRAIPVYGLFRIPARHAFEFTFAIGILAALGVAALESRRPSRRTVYVAAGVPLAAIGLSLAAFALRGHAILAKLAGGLDVSNIPVMIENPALAVPLIIAVVSAAAIACWRQPATRRYAAALAVAVAVADMTFFAASSYWRVSDEPATLPHVPQAVRTLSADLDRYGGRFADLGPNYGHSLHQNLPTLWGLDDFSGYVSLEYGPYEELARVSPFGFIPPQYLNEGNGITLDLAGARYLLLPPPEPQRAPLASAFAAEKIGSVIGATALTSQQSVTYQYDEPKAGSALAVLTALTDSAAIPNDAHVADAVVTGTSGTRTFPLLAGRDTADTAYDADGMRAKMRHAKARVFGGVDDSHIYIARFALPAGMRVRSLTVKWVYPAPNAGMLHVSNAGVVDDGLHVAYPFYALSSFRHDAAHYAQRQNIYDASGERVFENLRAFPHVWLAHRSTQQTQAQQLHSVHSGFVDGRRIDLHDEIVAAEPLLLAGHASPGDAVSAVTREPTLQTYDASCGGPCVLVTSDMWYPGWHASVDGAAARVLAVDYALRGVPVPAGRHRVAVWFAPASLRIGAAISGCALAIAIAYVALGLRRRTGPLQVVG